MSEKAGPRQAKKKIFYTPEESWQVFILCWAEWCIGSYEYESAEIE